MKQSPDMTGPDHPLEANEVERQWFQSAPSSYITAYRRAVETLTGGLPSWAARQVGGRPLAVGVKEHEEVQEMLALGIPMSVVARQYNTSRTTIARIRDTGGQK